MHRRTRGDMVEVYKLLQAKNDSDVSNIVKLHMIRYGGNCPLLTVVRPSLQANNVCQGYGVFCDMVFS